MTETGGGLLLTKLHIPRPRGRQVLRPRLTGLLRAGLDRKLTLISAPAGFGKTTLLSEWTPQSPQCVSWLSLDEGDNDPARFWTYFIAALQRLHSDVGAQALSLLQSPQPAPLQSVMIALANEIEAFPDSFSLVLDDCHAVEAPAIYGALDFLIDHLPSRMHLVISTRTDPPVALARLRARGQMVELRAADLRFTSAEAGEFLNGAMGIGLPDADVAVLEAQTEGWIAGLHLAALRLASPMAPGQNDRSGFIRAFSGANVFVLDYLVQEVLDRQPAEVRNFLLQTAILERLSGPLCDAVAGRATPAVSGPARPGQLMARLRPNSGGQAMLEALQQANLFISPLDDERRWYRYHHLFAEVLRARLQVEAPELVPVLHQRAAAWFEGQGRHVEAIGHALTGEDFTRAGRLVEQFGPPTIVSGQVHTALGWMNALPPEVICERPTVGVTHAAALMFTQDFAGAEAKLRDTESCVLADVGRSAAETRTILGRIAMTDATLVRFSGDLAGCVAFARQALDLLPEDQTFWRASPLVHAASAYRLTGEVSPAAERDAEAAVVVAQAAGNLFTTVRSLTNLAHLQVLRGRLRRAEVTYARVPALSPGPQGLGILIGSAAYYFGLGDLLRQRNELESAERLLVQGEALVSGTLAVDGDVVMMGYISRARLQHARGQFAAAMATLDDFARLAEERHYIPALLRSSEAARARLQLAQGELAAAQEWTAASGLVGGDCVAEDPAGAGAPPYPRQSEYLALACVLTAEGDISGALRMLAALERTAEAGQRVGDLIEILTLESLALQAGLDLPAAVGPLSRALALAKPEGYLRVFLDQGPALQWLLLALQDASAQPQTGSADAPAPSRASQEYAATVLTAFRTASAAQRVPPEINKNLRDASTKDALRIAAGPHHRDLVEPLSDRELQVLALLDRNLSNAEIAHLLYVSPETVKVHLKHIYGKLAVNSRSQAVVRARALSLL